MFKDTAENRTYPASWLPFSALREIHKDAIQKAKEPTKNRTEEPRGSDQQRQQKSHQQRAKLLAQKCQLEEDLKRVNRELCLLDESDVFFQMTGEIFNEM